MHPACQRGRRGFVPARFSGNTGRVRELDDWCAHHVRQPPSWQPQVSRASTPPPFGARRIPFIEVDANCKPGDRSAVLRKHAATYAERVRTEAPDYMQRVGAGGALVPASMLGENSRARSAAPSIAPTVWPSRPAATTREFAVRASVRSDAAQGIRRSGRTALY